MSKRIKRFEESGLMGCLDGTGVTSENYKEKLYGMEWISVKNIPLTRGLFAIVDEENFEWLMKFSWQTNERHDKKCFYAISRGGLRMHRLIMDCPDDLIVDHINGNGLDNRRSNLRIGSQSLNSVNRKNTPGVFLRGCRKKKNRWQAYIKIHGKQLNLGYFSSEKEAHEAYLKRAIEEYKDWMPLPEPPSA